MEDQINTNNTIKLIRFSWCDTVIILLIITGSLITFPALKSLTPATVVVFKDNQIIAEYPLGQNIIFDVKGNDGLMKIEVKNHSVSVRKSSCHHQLCVRQGSISQAHNQIVCIPNHILITISAKKDIILDAIVH